MRNKIALFVLSLSLVLCGWSESARAVKREGLMIGFNLGAAALFDDQAYPDRDSGVGFAMDFRVGGSFTPDWSLMLKLYGNSTYNNLNPGGSYWVSTYLTGVAAQYNFLNYFFFRMGPAAAITYGGTNISDVNVSKTRTGFGLITELGGEFYQTEKFAFDATFHTYPQWFSNSEGGFAVTIGGGIGVTWW